MRFRYLNNSSGRRGGNETSNNNNYNTWLTTGNIVNWISGSLFDLAYGETKNPPAAKPAVPRIPNSIDEDDDVVLDEGEEDSDFLAELIAFKYSYHRDTNE